MFNSCHQNYNDLGAQGEKFGTLSLPPFLTAPPTQKVPQLSVSNLLDYIDFNGKCRKARRTPTLESECSLSSAFQQYVDLLLAWQKWECGDPYQYKIPQNGDPWENLLARRMESDKVQCETWKDEVQNLLIFVSSTLAKEI